MNKTTFTNVCSYPGQPETCVSIETDADNLNGLLSAFKCFLLASGYVFEGDIDIVNDGESCPCDVQDGIAESFGENLGGGK